MRLALALFALALCGGWTHGSPGTIPPSQPCDMLALRSAPCTSAWSTARRMFASYSGPIFQLWRSSDSTTLNVGTNAATYEVDTTIADTTFCGSGNANGCYYYKFYDNNLSCGNDLLPGDGTTSHLLSYGNGAGGFRKVALNSGRTLPFAYHPISQQSHPGENFYMYGLKTGSPDPCIPTGNHDITVYGISPAPGVTGAVGVSEVTWAVTGPTPSFVPSMIPYNVGGSWPCSLTPACVFEDLENYAFVVTDFQGQTFNPLPTVLVEIGSYEASTKIIRTSIGDAQQGVLALMYEGQFTGPNAGWEGGLVLLGGGDGSALPPGGDASFIEGAILGVVADVYTTTALQNNILSFYGR